MTTRTNYFFPSKAAAWILLAGTLTSVPALGQEIIRWVDEEGVTHFGHPATANQKVIQAQPEVGADERMAENVGSQGESVIAAVTAEAIVPSPTERQETEKL